MQLDGTRIGYKLQRMSKMFVDRSLACLSTATLSEGLVKAC